MTDDLLTEEEKPTDGLSEDQPITPTQEQPLDFPETPAIAPTHNYHVANKKYVDDLTELIVSDNLRLSADTMRSSLAHTSYTKRKEIEVLHRGTIRIKFDLAAIYNPGVSTAYGKIYLNGVATGTERTKAIESYETFSEDIAIKAGDLVQLYAKNPTADGGYAVKNFRLYWDKSKVVDYLGVVNTD